MSTLLQSLSQSWLFVGISHPTKKIPIPGLKNPDPRAKKSPGYTEGKKTRIPEIKIGCCGVFLLLGANASGNPRDIQKKLIPIPKILGFFTRDFLGIFRSSRIKSPRKRSRKNLIPKPVFFYSPDKAKMPD